MPQNFIGGGDRGQGYLLPPDARQWLPPGHLAWALLEQAARLDMAPFAGWYRADGQGRPAYHPRLMVALVMSCYCKGVRSSRAVEMATWDDVGARVICAGLHPDHSTVHRFVSRHEAAVKGLLVASLVACARQGLVSVDVVAGDGTKVKASASMAANATAEQLEVEIAELEALLAAEVEAWFTQAQAAGRGPWPAWPTRSSACARPGPGWRSRSRPGRSRPRPASRNGWPEHASGWPAPRSGQRGRRLPPPPGCGTTSAAPPRRRPRAAAGAPMAGFRSRLVAARTSAAPARPPTGPGRSSPRRPRPRQTPARAGKTTPRRPTPPTRPAG